MSIDFCHFSEGKLSVGSPKRNTTHGGTRLQFLYKELLRLSIKIVSKLYPRYGEPPQFNAVVLTQQRELLHGAGLVHGQSLPIYFFIPLYSSSCKSTDFFFYQLKKEIIEINIMNEINLHR